MGIQHKVLFYLTTDIIDHNNLFRYQHDCTKAAFIVYTAGGGGGGGRGEEVGVVEDIF